MEKANIVDVEFLAKFYRVEERTIQNWANEFKDDFSLEVRYERGEYDFVKFVHAKNLHYEALIKRLEIGDISKFELEKELIKKRLIKEDIVIANLQNQNINIELVDVAWKSEVAHYAKSMRGLKSLLAQMIPDQSNYDQRYSISSKYIDEVLEQLANSRIIETEKNLERDLEVMEEAVIASEAKQSQEDEE